MKLAGLSELLVKVFLSGRKKNWNKKKILIGVKFQRCLTLLGGAVR